MELYREAIVREITSRSVTLGLLFLIGCIGVVIIVKVTDTWDLKYSKLFVLCFISLSIVIGGLVIFFETKDLNVDINNTDFVEYYGEATFNPKQSNRQSHSFNLNDSEKTLVTANSGKIEAKIHKCVARVVYGRTSKFVIIFEVEDILEERLPVIFVGNGSGKRL